MDAPIPNPVPEGICSLIWMGVRTDKFQETVGFYRDIMRLPVLREGTDFAWFTLANGVELHVYGPSDDDHAFFGVGPVVGFEVSDFSETRARMIEAGIEFIGDVQENETRMWNHFRGTDGNIYEIMSKKDSAACS